MEEDKDNIHDKHKHKDENKPSENNEGIRQSEQTAPSPPLNKATVTQTHSRNQTHSQTQPHAASASVSIPEGNPRIETQDSVGEKPQETPQTSADAAESKLAEGEAAENGGSEASKEEGTSTTKRKRKRKRKDFKNFKPGFRKSTRTASREDTTMSSLGQLARSVLTGRKVVFLTGAGLSVASGIPPFRGATDAVWTQSVREWGTRKKFKESPLAWYNTFWLKHFDESKAKDYKPNPGHEAIAKLCAHFSSSVNVITQNVDRLHRHTSGSVADEQLIEIHGSAGAFKCLTEDCSYAESKLHYAELNVSSTKDGTVVESVEYLPKCPDCSEIMCPNVLLFDEDYDSHESYQFDKAREWLEAADVIAFVGTSFAVHITNLAFEHARDRSVPAVAYNFNVIDNLPATKASTIETRLVLGKTEETLPKLVACILK